MEPLSTTFCPLESTQYTRNKSLNETTWSSNQEADYIYICVSLVICVLGLAGNGLLIWFLIFCIKRKPFTVYILHLAIADFLVLLCSSIIQLVNTFHIYDDTLLTYTVFFMLFGYNTGLHLLTAISVERCLSVLFPIWYQCRRPKHQSAVACALLWALSVLVSGLENFFCIMKLMPQFPECRYVYLFSCILTFLVFVPLMVFSNLILFIQVCCNLKPRQPVKLYVIIMVTVILFLLFAMPMKVLLIITYYSYTTDESVWYSLPYLNMLSTINSSINPIVYFVVGSLRRKRSRKSLKEALQKVFEEKPEVGSRENVA
ncbi:mas-related G-protein coupled receptor member H isoform X2 [Cricetulus griseus]|uniref:Mas-related G-protein coupled receptor member H isoform X2 n=1 Tax=Cricetulus griseus TaxID=10029 RepID=A0A9J7GMM6_CRIGR|nr:mas-related G-protein coupled receptor member H isoform X2 [Cricetulus griseus]ERE86390.1 mas-related G-protein coupled receptor member H-like protein [Cricetulus griseus]